MVKPPTTAHQLAAAFSSLAFMPAATDITLPADILLENISQRSRDEQASFILETWLNLSDLHRTNDGCSQHARVLVQDLAAISHTMNMHDPFVMGAVKALPRLVDQYNPLASTAAIALHDVAEYSLNPVLQMIAQNTIQTLSMEFISGARKCREAPMPDISRTLELLRLQKIDMQH